MRAFIVAITLALATFGSAAAQQDQMRPPRTVGVEVPEPQPTIVSLCVMSERVSTPQDRLYTHVFLVHRRARVGIGGDAIIEINTNGMQLVQRALAYSPSSAERDRQYESQTELLRAAAVARVVVDAYINQYDFIEKLLVQWSSPCTS